MIVESSKDQLSFVAFIMMFSLFVKISKGVSLAYLSSSTSSYVVNKW